MTGVMTQVDRSHIPAKLGLLITLRGVLWQIHLYTSNYRRKT
jgi:hypothetical protein